MARTALSLLIALALADCGSNDRRSVPPRTISGEPPSGRSSDVASAGAPRSGVPTAEPTRLPQGNVQQANPCFVQEGKRLEIATKLARGTEPFWSARIDGRCVIYATPENMRGIRVWTHYHAGENSQVWSGSLDGRLFELVLQAQPGCSDGMSDERYRIAAHLLINGERRSGCAK